jgi:SAM-dependent methyltransferase
MENNNYLDLNKAAWNSRTDIHVDSEFYGMADFLNGQSSLKEIEMQYLKDIEGKKLLHLQCHFGQDTLSLTRLGAKVTGVDLSDRAIDKARQLATDLGIDASFVCCDVYNSPDYIDDRFDVVYTTYGTIGWLPDLDKWAKVIAHFLKPGGRLIFVEFHPVVWMFDNDFDKVGYNYFNSGPIEETESGTYADRNANITNKYVSWNHSISEVVNSLIRNGLAIEILDEFDYSPYNCFNKTVEFEPGKFRIEHLGDKIPMVYSIVAQNVVSG